MRLLLSLLVVLAVTPSSFASPKGKPVPGLLSFDEVMLMTSPQRAQYFHEFGKLLALLEDANAKYELASLDTQGTKEKFARLLREFAFVNEARAEGEAVQPADPYLLKRTNPDVPSGASGFQVMPESLRQPAAPDGTAAPAVSPTAGEGSALKNDPPTDPPAAAGEDPPAPTVGGACTPVEQGTPEYAKLKSAWQSDRSYHGECVRGGFFSSYDKGAFRYQGCKPQRVTYTEITKGKSSTHELTCQAGEQICNPTVFCAGIEMVTPAKTIFQPVNVCAKVDSHFTKNCNRELEAIIGKPLKHQKVAAKRRKVWESYKDEKVQICDPAKDFPNMAIGPVYSELYDSTQKMYASLCGGNEKFRALFCEECEVIGKHVIAMVEPFKREHKRLTAAPAAAPAAAARKGTAPKPPRHVEITPDAAH